MRLEKMEYGAYEAAWKRDGDTVEVDYLKERIPFFGPEQLYLENVIGIHKFDVSYREMVKFHFFKANEYGAPTYLHVLAIERKNYKGNVWLFLCDSKKLFCSLAREFAAAFTYTYIYNAPDNKSEERTHYGSAQYNASSFYEEAVKSDGAKLEFLYYLLDKGEDACKEPVFGCAFTVPGEKHNARVVLDDIWETEIIREIAYPSKAEKCVILDGEDFEKLYEDISLLLPERIEVTKSIAQVKAAYGIDFSNKGEVLKEFQQSLKSEFPLLTPYKLTSHVQKVRDEMSRWTIWIGSNQVEKNFGEEYLTILSQKLDIFEKLSQTDKLEQQAKQKKKNSDNSGEKAVEYEINWFTASCKEPIISIAANCESKYRYNCILLAKPDFIDEYQEYDHILVCPGGIFLIETKHWKGTVEIRSGGKWIRYIDGARRGVENPQSQIWRHETLMKAIVPGIAVSSVLCFSNADVVIDGKEHFTDYPIIYVDQLKDYLNQFCRNKLYSEEDIRSIVQTIESHKVNRMSKQ